MTAVRRLLLTLAATFAFTIPAQAASLRDAIKDGTPIIDLRARYETVQDATKPFDAHAQTLRARLGYETAAWNGLQLAVDFDQVWAIGGKAYNSTRNGRTAYPLIADPAMTALNRLQLSYASDFGTRFVIGRQRLPIGNQRFIGNIAWRQHEQTFDALSLVNTSLPGLTFTYGYLYRVNRINGPDVPVPSNTLAAATGQANYFKSDSHVMDGVYTAIPGLRLEAYAFLLDLSAPGYATLPAQQVAAARLSTATYGGRADYSIPLVADVTGKITAEYARQTNHAGNPLSLGLDYWLGEASVSHGPASLMAGYEVLDGNGTIGFATPLATLHIFNGWADLFLTTPVDGLKDFYLKAAYVLAADDIGMKSLTGTVIYHSYDSARLDAWLGSEWDLQAELAVDASTSFLFKYADYHGAGIPAGGFPSKSVAWLQAAYKY
jgi:hypothetical protein